MKTITFKILLIFVVFKTSLLFGQDPSGFIYIEDVQYSFSDYLINSGRAMPDFVFQQPYSTSFFNKIQKDFAAGKYFMAFWNRVYRDGLSAQLELKDKAKYQNQNLFNRYRAVEGVHIVYPNIILANRTAIDQEYKYDPLYAGDLSESDHWLYGRVNDAYMNVQFQNFAFFLGRIKRNWGPVNSKSLILSDNPYTYDHALFTFQNKFLQLSLIFAQLEDLPALGLNDGDATDSLTFYSNAHRFLTGHRLDLRIAKNFQIGLTEMATYGGPDRTFDLSFANPMTFYYGLQRNDGKMMDGSWALDLFYKPMPKITLYSQILVDDFIVNNDPGVDDRANLPDRLGVYFSFRTGDFFLTWLNTDLSYHRIWNDTYQSRWTWENYHYRGLGLGYPCASCEEIELKLGYWELFPLFIQNELVYGRYGDVSSTNVFLLEKRDFPAPPVAFNLSNKFSIRYFKSPAWQFFLNFESFKNANHYRNRMNEKAAVTVSFGFRYLFSAVIK